MRYEVNKKYYNDDKLYEVSFYVSNAINPTFEVWAQCEQYALDEIAVYLVENGMSGLYFDEAEADEIDYFYLSDNGIFLDLSCIYMDEAS